MKLRTVIVLTAITLPTVAATQEAGKFQCSYGDMQRRVEIASEPGVEVPCSVHYFKDTEMPGEQQVLWSAANDPTYCRDKAMELVAKLEGWGWDCGRASATSAEEETAEESATAESEEMLGDPEPDVVEEPDSNQ